MESINLFLDNLSPKNVLDLGVGDGNKSLAFLEKGSKITGIDKIQQKISPKINFILSDIRDFVFTENYDLIIASLILHFLKKDEAIRIINSMKKNTSIGGHNFILNLTPKDSFATKKSENFYVFEDELKRIYADWEIIHFYSFSTPYEEHDGLPKHKHFITGLLAKRIK